MSEPIIPDELQQPSDVLEQQNQEQSQMTAAEEPKLPSFAEKTLSELVDLLKALLDSEDNMKRSKEADAIKSSFYKRLIREKLEAGLISSDEAAKAAEPSDASMEDSAGETVSQASPFDAVEAAFKDLFATYKRLRAEYNKQQDEEREANFVKKTQVIEDLKALLEKQEEVKDTFPQFREIQNRWREIGPVPAQKFRDLNDTYQFQVERFYDMVKINRDLRDLDFKKNLEAKEAFCQAAEKLSENENVVEAFHELQKLHEQWKEFGPVAKEFRDSIWERFKAATAVINKKYQAHFEGLKEEQEENLKKKEALCVKLEEIAEKEIKSSNEWNSLSKEIENVQAEWKTIGYASKKDNQKIYDRFRAACDKFFERKRVFYTEYKDSMNDNLSKKLAIIEEAETIKTSTEWKKTTDRFIELQKMWKEVGAVPRKRSEQLWQRFRAACDEFFDNREKNGKAENELYVNLKSKKALIAEIEAFSPSGDSSQDQETYNSFVSRWQAIGHVPYKEKDNVAQAYRAALDKSFPERGRRGNGRNSSSRGAKSPKDILIDKFNALQQDINTYENNLGFFSRSKNAESLIAQMQSKIASAKEELQKIADEIRNAEKKDETNE